MGTNYYLETDICTHCSRYKDRLHIGKSSAGWTFSFHGYRQCDGDNIEILSVKKWEELTSDTKSRIVDEYGEEIQRNDFWGMVNGKMDAQNNHYDYCVIHHPDTLQYQWKDGPHSFSSGEFS